MIRIKPATPATRRPTYMDGLDYIACNDAPECMDRNEVSGLVSVQLLGALFGIPAESVAFDVIRIRALLAKNVT